jgi:hypothetical protein
VRFRENYQPTTKEPMRDNDKTMTTDSKIPEGCLPFNLEKARSGHLCRTRSGLVARYVGEIRNPARAYSLLWDITEESGWGYQETTTEDGTYMFPLSDAALDVFLTAPKKVKRTAWANMLHGTSGDSFFHCSYLEGRIFKTEAEAQRHNVGDSMTTCKIEWEETEHDNK